MATPLLPDWIRRPQVSGYTAAHRLCPEELRLFGTESLFGDWHGKVLLLAKDFAPSSFLLERIAAGDPRPFRHDPTRRANIQLEKFVGPLRDRGLLYGSALANLLRDDGKWSGSLPNRSEALAYGTEVLKFVIVNMPHLETIVCMGSEAWECACRATGVAGDWRGHRDAGRPLGPLVATYHPSARVSRVEMERSWGHLLRAA